MKQNSPSRSSLAHGSHADERKLTDMRNSMPGCRQPLMPGGLCSHAVFLLIEVSIRKTNTYVRVGSFFQAGSVSEAAGRKALVTGFL